MVDTLDNLKSKGAADNVNEEVFVAFLEVSLQSISDRSEYLLVIDRERDEMRLFFHGTFPLLPLTVGELQRKSIPPVLKNGRD